MLSCTRFCNRARELLERAALEALDDGELVERAHHVHRRALFITSSSSWLLLLVSLPLFADSLFSLPAPSLPLSLSLCRLSLRFPLCHFLGRAFSLGYRVGLHLFSCLSRSSFKFLQSYSHSSSCPLCTRGRIINSLCIELKMSLIFLNAIVKSLILTIDSPKMLVSIV